MKPSDLQPCKDGKPHELKCCVMSGSFGELVEVNPIDITAILAAKTFAELCSHGDVFCSKCEQFFFTENKPHPTLEDLSKLVVKLRKN